MASSKKSTKSAKRVCVTCRKPKSEVEFPTTSAETCIDCEHELQKQRENLPDQQETEADEAPFEANAVEIDYSNPTSRELASRTLARRRLLHFVKRFRPKYDAGWVHEDICRRLERFVEQVELGLEPRLLLCAPVRHGKSEICSRHFAPWVMGKHPEWEFIAASGAQSLATSFSRYIRDVVRSDSYQALYPEMRLDPTSTSVENWNTTKGGGYLAAGVGTMITGRGAHVLLIDDAVKDAEAADSPVIRDNVWEWYISTALSRLAPGGGVLVVMTLWNEDDLGGRLQQLSAMDDGGDKFEVVKYPAVNDKGDEYILEDDSIVQITPGSDVPENARMTRPMNTALHPARYSYESLMRRKATYAALGQQRWWSALYQQSPSPDEGVYFSKDLFAYYSTAPHRLDTYVYQAWDFAISTSQTSDYTVCATIAVDHRDAIYVLDILRFKTGDGIRLAETMVRQAREWDVVAIGVEDGQIWKSIETQFTKACDEARYWPQYEVLKPLTDKMVRASPLKGRMQSGKVFFDKKAAWYGELESEFLRFPAGKHDDQIDACFVKGTQILMGDGSQRNVEDVVRGNYVHTPLGPRKVLEAWLSERNTEVCELELSDGRVLVATSSHRVFTDRGWVSIANLTESDMIHVRESQELEDLACHEFTKKQPPVSRALSSTGLSIEDTLSLDTSTCSDISPSQVADASCTGMSGSTTTGQSRKVFTSTTKTGTTSIIRSRTLSASAVRLTHRLTKSFAAVTDVLRSSLPISVLFVNKLLSGIQALLGESGTASMQKQGGIPASDTHLLVSAVATASSLHFEMPSIAGNRAKTRSGGKHTLSMMRRSVLEQKQDVYNVSVAEAECYYANGVLVHNCAWATRLTLARTAPKQKVNEPKTKSWKDKLKGLARGSASHMAS